MQICMMAHSDQNNRPDISDLKATLNPNDTDQRQDKCWPARQIWRFPLVTCIKSLYPEALLFSINVS
jgi:hypothetical protein